MNQNKKLAVFDIDGVLYDGNIVFDVIKKQDEEGYIEKGTWGKIMEALGKYKAKEWDYKTAANNMLDNYVYSIRGKLQSDLALYIKNYTQTNSNHFYPYVESLFPKLSKTHDIYIITTNLDTTASVVSELIGAKGYIATVVEVKNGILTGRVLESMAGQKQKISTLIEKYGYSGSIAVGDSVNDIPMLEKVERPIAVNPDEKLKERAKRDYWDIVDVNSLEDIILQVK